MKQEIYCPSCGKNKNLLIFSPGGEEHDLYCKECNFSYSIKLLEMSERSEKKHDDLYFYIFIASGNKLITENFNNNFDPVLKCVLCRDLLADDKDKQKDWNDKNYKCNSCGALYDVEIN